MLYQLSYFPIRGKRRILYHIRRSPRKGRMNIFSKYFPSGRDELLLVRGRNGRDELLLVRGRNGRDELLLVRGGNGRDELLLVRRSSSLPMETDERKLVAPAILTFR